MVRKAQCAYPSWAKGDSSSPKRTTRETHTMVSTIESRARRNIMRGAKPETSADKVAARRTIAVTSMVERV